MLLKDHHEKKSAVEQWNEVNNDVLFLFFFSTIFLHCSLFVIHCMMIPMIFGKIVDCNFIIVWYQRFVFLLVFLLSIVYGSYFFFFFLWSQNDEMQTTLNWDDYFDEAVRHLDLLSCAIELAGLLRHLLESNSHGQGQKVWDYINSSLASHGLVLKKHSRYSKKKERHCKLNVSLPKLKEEEQFYYGKCAFCNVVGSTFVPTARIRRSQWKMSSIGL